MTQDLSEDVYLFIYLSIFQCFHHEITIIFDERSYSFPFEFTLGIGPIVWWTKYFVKIQI